MPRSATRSQPACGLFAAWSCASHLLAAAAFSGMRHDRQLLAPSASMPFPADMCGKYRGPCDDSRCPASSNNCTDKTYCAPLTTSASLGYDDYQICLNATADCGTREGAACCPPRWKGNLGQNKKGYAYCMPDGLFCPAPFGDLTATCKKVPTGCGGFNQTCCPTLYRQFTDKVVPVLCGNYTYCGPGSTCQPNPPDCGTLGKVCCIHSVPSSTVSHCDAGLVCPYVSTGPALPCASCSSAENLLNPSCTNSLSQNMGVPAGVRPVGPLSAR